MRLSGRASNRCVQGSKQIFRVHSKKSVPRSAQTRRLLLLKILCGVSTPNSGRNCDVSYSATSTIVAAPERNMSVTVLRAPGPQQRTVCGNRPPPWKGRQPTGIHTCHVKKDPCCHDSQPQPATRNPKSRAVKRKVLPRRRSLAAVSYPSSSPRSLCRPARTRHGCSSVSLIGQQRCAAETNVGEQPAFVDRSGSSHLQTCVGAGQRQESRSRILPLIFSSITLAAETTDFKRRVQIPPASFDVDSIMGQVSDTWGCSEVKRPFKQTKHTLTLPWRGTQFPASHEGPGARFWALT